MNQYTEQDKLYYEVKKLKNESSWLRLSVIPIGSFILSLAIFFLNESQQANDRELAKLTQENEFQIATMNLVFDNYDKFFSEDTVVLNNIYATYFVIKETYKTSKTDSIYNGLIRLADSLKRTDIVNITNEIEKKYAPKKNEFELLKFSVSDSSLNEKSVAVSIGDFNGSVIIENNTFMVKIPKKYFRNSSYFLELKVGSKTIYEDPINDYNVKIN